MGTLVNSAGNSMRSRWRALCCVAAVVMKRTIELILETAAVIRQYADRCANHRPSDARIIQLVAKYYF